MDKLGKLIRNDFVVAFHSSGVWMSLTTGIVLSITQYFKESYSVRKFLDVYLKEWPSMLVPHTVFTKWIGGEAYSFQYFAFFIMIPLLCTLPAGSKVSLEKKSRYGLNVLVRTNKNTYYLSKTIVAFLLGGTVTVLPLLFNLYLTAMTLPSIVPNNATGFFAITNQSFLAEIFYERPYLYVFIYIIIIFLFSGIIAAAACSMGIWGINPFLNTIYPFLVGVTLYAILGELHIYSWIPFFFLNPAQLESVSLFPIVSEAILLVIITIFSFYRGNSLDVY